MKAKLFLVWLLALCACVWMVRRVGLPAKNDNETAQTESVSVDNGAVSRPSGGKTVGRLSRRNADGRVAVSSIEEKRLPAKAEVAMARTEAEDARAKIASGLSIKPSTVLAMYDISINSDGRKWQPESGEPVQVNVELPEPVAVTPGSTLGLVHLADNGTVERLPENRYAFAMNSTKSAVTGFSFLADGFSVYAITQDGTPGFRIYSFYNLVSENNTEIYEPYYFIAADGTETFQQVVKSGETMEEPEALPSPNGITFAGWYLYDETKAGQTVDGVTYGSDGYSEQPFDFKKPVVFSESGQQEFALRAVYKHKAYVVFHEQKMAEKWPIIGVRSGILSYNQATGKWDTSVTIGDIAATYDDPEDEHNENGAPKMIFRGWSLTEVPEGSHDYELVENPLPISMDLSNTGTSSSFQAINLYPVFVNINWISYYTAEPGSGATYVAPTYHYEDTGIESLTNTINLTGYTFTGWYTDTNTSTRVKISDANGVLNTSTTLPAGWGGYFSDGKLMLTNSVTIYAGWATAPTKYTVVVLKQSLNDDKDATEKTYDFAESHSINGKNTGDLTDEPTAYQNLDFKGFYYSRTDAQKEISADGSTVINVYYDRYKVTYSFTNGDYIFTDNIIYSGNYLYTETTADAYIYTVLDGIISGSYRYTETTASAYIYTVSTSIQNGQYWITEDGVIYTQQQLYYNNSRWYKTRTTGSYGRYSYSDEYTGVRYTRTDDTPKQYYTNDGTSFSRIYYVNNAWRTTNNDNGAIYTGTRFTRTSFSTSSTYCGEDGNQVYYRNKAWRTSDNNNGAIYTGTVYIRTDDTPDQYYTTNGTSFSRIYYVNGAWRKSNSGSGEVYTGSRYVRTSYSTNNSTVYGTDDGENFYQIYYRNNAWRKSNSNSGAAYNGTLYSGDNPDMTGLYGQTLSMYGYTWPTKYKWTVVGGSTYMTYLETFNYISYANTSTSTHTKTQEFSQDGVLGNKEVWHILQRLDGSYSTNYVETAVVAYVSNNAGNFQFTEKFEGFTLCGFSENGFTETPLNSASAGGHSNGTYPLYVYYKRNTYTITFYDSYNNDEYAKTNVYYGAQLSTDIVPASCASPTPTDPGIKDGFEFKGWYADEDTSTRFNFDRTMPMNDLRAYTRWGKVYYLVKVNPNYGTLGGGELGSTWFWEPAFGGEEIREYKTTERNFEESIDGTYYYAEHVRSFYGLTDEWEDREDYEPFKTEISDRRTYYTQDPSDPAIIDTSKRYSYAPKAYRYSGWYEVFSDGSEKLYAFGQQVTHNTVIKLHWKKIGTYHLVYVAGGGVINDDDESEDGAFKTIDGGFYADSSEVLVTRIAEPPTGKVFVGWKIRYGGDKVYRPGQSFSFNSGYTVSGTDSNGNTVKQLILDAVYSDITTVSLTFDGNGATLDSDYTGTGLNLDAKLQSDITATPNGAGSALTVTGLRNNYFGNLDSGTAGFSSVIDDNELEFAGWNTKADGTGTHFDPGAQIYLNSEDTDANGNNTLYAQWKVKVYFDKNNERASWGTWDTTKYTFDDDRQMYYQETTLNGYASDPNAALSGDADHMFQFWSEVRYELTDEYSLDQAYDFSAPVTRADLVLYARWWNLLEVPIHAVDASDQTLVNKDNEWLVKDSSNNPVKKIKMNVDTVVEDLLESSPTTYVDASAVSGYAYAFACISDSIENITESSKIDRIYYNIEAKHVYVTFADGTEGPLPEDNEIFFVYFQNPMPVNIGYVAMDNNGSLALANLNNTTRPTTVQINTVAYNMSTNIAAMSYRNSGSTYKYYAYAIGDANVPSDANASLHIITSSKSSDTDEPQLQVRNTWRGYQYSTDGGTSWSVYGYDMQLYVVYFESQPTIINLHEQTIGTEADMAEQFEYNVTVTTFEKKVTTERTRRSTATLSQNSPGNNVSGNYYESNNYIYLRIDGTWYRFSKSQGWNSWESNSPQDDVEEKGDTETTYLLANDDVTSITLFSSSTPGTWGNSSYSRVRVNYKWYAEESQTKEDVEYFQQLVIIQTVNNDFTTMNDGGGSSTDSTYGDGQLLFKYESLAGGGEKTVTYTNMRKELPIELHVALAQGSVVALKDEGDDGWRTADSSKYTVSVTLSADSEFLVTSDALLARTNSAATATYLLKDGADTTGSSFAGVYYGTKNNDGVVTIVGSVKEIGLVKPSTGDYYELTLKTDDDVTVPMGDYELFYVYTEMPKVYYMTVGANGALTAIDAITYNGSPISMNGEAGGAVQGEELALGSDAFTVRFGGTTGANIFRVSPTLDGVTLASLNRSVLAAGKSGVTATANMDGTTTGDSIQLKIDGGFVKWSTNGSTWNDFTGSPTVYAIYKEVGYDLNLKVTSLANETDKASDSFTVTIACPIFSSSVSYVVSGYSLNDVAVESLTPADGKITLTVKHGSDVTIHALPYGERNPSTGVTTFHRYTITEAFLDDAEDYVMKVVNVDGNETSSPIANENGTYLYMEADKEVEFVNAKKYDVTFYTENKTEVLKAATKYLYGTLASEIVTPASDTIPAKPMNAAKDCIYRFKGWKPVLADVTDDAEYEAEYREIKVPSATQRSTGDNLTIKLADCEGYETVLINTLKSLDADKLDMEKSGYSVTAANAWLNQVDDNGLKRWENIVTGTAYTQDLLVGMASNSETSQMNMRIWDKPVALTDLGYKVQYVLQKTIGTGWNQIAGPTTDALAVDMDRPGLAVPLLDNEGKSAAASGLYRIVTQIIPLQREAITNEIPSKNIDGILEVNSTYTNMVVASPWVACDTDKPAVATLADTDTAADANVTIEKLMANVNLATGDKIYAYDTSANVHYGWEKIANRGSETDAWESFISAAPDGVTTANPVSSTMSRGGAFWLVRPTPLAADGSLKPVFVCGQHLAGDYTVTVPGGGSTEPVCVLIANPTMYDVDINSLKFTGDIGAEDTIWVPTANTAVPTTVRRNVNSGKWEVKSSMWYRNRWVTVWVTEGKIPAGTGFWYTRRTAGDLTLTWDGWREEPEKPSDDGETGGAEDNADGE